MHDQQRTRWALIFELLAATLIEPRCAVVRHESLRLSADSSVAEMLPTPAYESLSPTMRAQAAAPPRVFDIMPWARSRISCGGVKGAAIKSGDSRLRCVGCECAMSETVDDEQRKPVGILFEVPGVATIDLSLERDADSAVPQPMPVPKRAITIVPSPGAEWISNSVASRRTAPRPVPGVPEVEYPSVMQRATSAMPGPRSMASSSTQRRRRRPASESAARRRPRGAAGC